MKKQYHIAACILCSLICSISHAQQLKRKAYIGAWGKADSTGLTVDTIIPGSTLNMAGIKKHDRIVSLNGKTIKTLYDFSSTASAVREGEELSLVYVPHQKSKNKSITLKALPKPVETNPHAEVRYEWIKAGDCYSRSILYLPKGVEKPPVILFIPGYNCGSIENFSSNFNGKMRDAWLQAGYAVACVEKSGVGDSYCKPCIEATLADDIAIYSATYEYLQTLGSVNNKKIILWGHSMGGVIAPLLAEKYQPAGVMVFATVYRPWSEFLLEMHRVQAPLDGKSYTETEDFVRNMHRIYFDFFVLKKSPEQINEAHEDLRPLMASEMEYKPGSTLQWGRHWRFWQQIDSVNLARSWSNVNCPVLSIFGGSDFIQCSPFEHELIVETVNKSHPGQATHITIPHLDHLMASSATRAEAHENFKDIKYIISHFNPEIAEATVSWLQRFKV